MESTEAFIAKFEALSIKQQQLVTEIVDELTENHSIGSKEDNKEHTNAHRRINRSANHNFISSNGIPLAIGDRVKLLSTRKTGKKGDTAEIIKFNKLYVAVKLEKNRSVTQRASKYLEHTTE